MKKNKNICLIISIIIAVAWIIFSIYAAVNAYNTNTSSIGEEIGKVIGMAMVMPYLTIASIGTILHVLGACIYKKGLVLAGLIIECVSIPLMITWSFGYILVIIFGFIGFAKMKKKLPKEHLEEENNTKELSNENTIYCPNCRTAVKFVVSSKKNTIIPIVIAIIISGFIGILIGEIPTAEPEPNSSTTQIVNNIDKCTRQLEFFDGINADAVNVFVEYVPQFETNYSGFKSAANKSNTFSLMLNNKTYTIITSNTGEVITIINDNTGNYIYGTYEEKPEEIIIIKPEPEIKKEEIVIKPEVKEEEEIIIKPEPEPEIKEEVVVKPEVEEEVPPIETEKENTYTSTLGEKNALKEAKTYLNISTFSKEGLIKQLKYEGYNTAEIDYAISNCNANYKEECCEEAETYLNISAFSKESLIKQLAYEGYTPDEIDYAIFNCDANYNEECYEEAETYLSFSTFSKEGLIKQLKYEGYTQSQIDYALNKIGY